MTTQPADPAAHGMGIPLDPTLQALVRPILELVQEVTGLESTYLTSIDLGTGRQSVLIARNTGELAIPEGLHVPWQDTLCRRALAEGHMVERDVPARWGDSDAARLLGIRTYVSCPVRADDGRVQGTLCAASTRSQDIDATGRRVLEMASRLVALHVDREALVAALRRANAELARSALTDPVTGLPNRRALELELGRMLARAQRDGMAVFVAFIDLDDFKRVNDRHGHEAGDRLLRAIGVRLADGLRGGDLVARFGGDEFVVAGTVPRETAEASAQIVRARLAEQTAGGFDVDGTRASAGASVGLVISRVGEFDAGALLSRADAAMYDAKRERKSRA
ncbi:GGDEF domain-containing protein [Lysobacter humi (ex Lee et al. 2017)]